MKQLDTGKVDGAWVLWWWFGSGFHVEYCIVEPMQRYATLPPSDLYSFRASIQIANQSCFMPPKPKTADRETPVFYPDSYQLN